jgi:hypothetical protein
LIYSRKLKERFAKTSEKRFVSGEKKPNRTPKKIVGINLKLNKMKKVFYSSLILLLTFFIFSCSNENEQNDNTLNSKQLSEKLSKNSEFISFANNYVKSFINYSNYQRNILNNNYYRNSNVTSNNSGNFLTDISNESLTIDEVEQVHLNYSLDFNKVVDFKNSMDNFLYSFCVNNPEVLEVSSQQEFEQIILDAMDIAYLDGTFVIDNILISETNSNLTADEIWNCAKQAVGIGFLSYLSIKGLKAAGATIITKAFTKFISKFAGPIGTAIMVADFGFCLYGESQD